MKRLILTLAFAASIYAVGHHMAGNAGKVIEARHAAIEQAIGG